MPAGDSERELTDVVASLEYAAQAFKQKNYSAAEPIYRRAFEVLERNFGAGDPDTIACLQSLGDIYYQMGRYADAMPHYKRLLVIGEKVLGRKHPRVIDMVLRLAATYQQLGLNDDAETLFRRANTMSQSSMSTLNNPLPDVKPSQAISSASLNAIATPPSLSRQTNTRLQGHQPPKPQRTNSRIPAEMPPKPGQSKSRFAEDAQPASGPMRKNVGRFDDVDEPPQPPRNNKKNEGSKSDPGQNMFILMRRSAGVVISLVVVGVLIFCGYMMLKALNTSSAKPTQLNHLKGSSYKTSDGQIDLNISSNGDPTYKVGNQTYAATVTAMGPDLMDFKESILSSLLNKEVWFEETPLGLRREDGTVLYAKNGPELKVVRQLDLISKIANSWFQQRREYPGHQGDILLGDLSQNPVSLKPEMPSVDRLESGSDNVQDFVDVPVNNLPMEKILESVETPNWLREAAPYGGGIHCLHATQKLPSGEVRKFFAHAFDRNGKFIAGSRPGTVYLIAYSNGKQYLPEPISAAKIGRPPRLCVVQLPSNTPIWLLHYFTPIFCMSMALMFFMAGKASKSANQRDSGVPMASRIGVVFLFIGLLWVVGYFVP